MSGHVTRHRLDLEQAVLGAVLLAPSQASLVTLRERDFYDPTHAALWAEMAARYRAGSLVDAATLRSWADEHLIGLGGVRYLLTLMDHAAPLSAQVSGYCVAIRQAARDRAVIAAARQAIELASSDSDADALTALELALQQIAVGDDDADAWERAGAGACEAIERAELGETRGVSTGFRALDAKTGGLQPGTLWVIGAATSMGKSVFGAALANNVGAQGYGVAEVHLEMDATQVGLRRATAAAFVRDHRADNPAYLSAARGELPGVQWQRLRTAGKALQDLPIYCDARPGRTLSQIEAAGRRLFERLRREGVKPGAIIVDHEGLIAPEPGAKHASQLEATSARATGLLAMAKRLGVTVIALSQITKEGSRADGVERLPTVHDLNYGSALSQAASVAILLHRVAYYEERKPRDLRDASKLRSRECVLVVDKSRAGQRAHVSVLMDMPTAAVWEEAA